MIYTVAILTLKADCQALINIANAEKDDLSYRRAGLVRQSQTATSTSLEIESGNLPGERCKTKESRVQKISA